jgi:hypothetical protein
MPLTRFRDQCRRSDAELSKPSQSPCADIPASLLCPSGYLSFLLLSVNQVEPTQIIARFSKFSYKNPKLVIMKIPCNCNPNHLQDDDQQEFSFI